MTPIRPWINSRPWAHWAAALAAVLALGLAASFAGRSTTLALGLLAGGVLLVGALLLWQAPGLILIALLLNVWLVAGRADPGDLLPSLTAVRWLSYLIIPAYALLALARVWLRGGRWRLTGLEPFLAGLVLLTILSGLVNHTGAAAIVLSLAVYLRYPLLFLVLYNLDLGEKPYLVFLRSLVLVALWLIAEAIFNWLVFHRSSDGTFFTTGVQFGTSNAGLLMVYATCLVCAHALVTRWRWYHVVFLVSLLVASLIATIRSLLLLVPVLPVAMWAVRYRLVGVRRLPRLSAIALVGILGLALALGPTLASESEAYGLKYFVQLRLIGTADVLSVMAAQNREWLGFGPRSYSPGSLGAVGEMYQLELQRHGLYWVTNFDLSELATGLTEMGLVGFGVFWLMLVSLLVAVLRFWRELLHSEPDARQRQRWSLIMLAFVGMWLHYALLGMVYYEVWRLDATSLVFWGAAAAILARRRAWRRQVTEAHV